MWVWVNSWSWWRTGRPGVLWFMGSQRVGHDWATDLIWSDATLWIYQSLFHNEHLIVSIFCYCKEYVYIHIKYVSLYLYFTFKLMKYMILPLGKSVHLKPFISVQFSRSVMSDSLWPHGMQHARPPCPSPTPRVYSNSCPLSRWCHPTISSSVVPFSPSIQSFPASGSFQMSQFFTWGGQSIGVSDSASVLPMNTQDWSPDRKSTRLNSSHLN